VISLEEARAIVLGYAHRLPSTRVALLDGLGCVLATDVHARGNVPPFDTTAMDGYAVHTGDTAGATPTQPVRLPVLGTIFAGAPAPALPAGSVWKIMTGAPVPPGADAVIPVEDSDGASIGEVELRTAARLGAHIRSAGSNIAAGSRVLRAGTVLGPIQIGVLAGIGVRTIEVLPRPRVGVLVTGDELVADERDLQPGEIYESNQDMLLALLTEAGCIPIDLGIVADDEDQLRARLDEASQRCDAIVTSGGVSMGDADPVKALLSARPRSQWMQIAIRPAKPFLLSELDGPQRPVPLFGLPGNPVSAFVSFELLVVPALAQLSGRSPDRTLVTAIADVAMANERGDTRTTYLRVSTAFGPDGRLHARPVSGGQESHQLAASADATALAQLPDGTRVEIGDDIAVLLLTSR
jgi:molybdopterin molybdotransferase